MKQSFLTTLSAFLFIAFTLTSCQQEEVASPNNPLTFRAPPTCTDGIQNGSETGVDCGGSSCAPCAILYTWTDNAPCAGEDLIVTFCNGLGSNCGNTQIQQWINGEFVQVAMATPTNGCLSYTVTGAAAGSYLFRAQWVSSGGGCSGANTGWVEHTAEVISCGCDDELSAQVTCSSDACNRSVTFTYTAGDDVDAIVIQGGLTHFTTICTATATGGLVQNLTHPSLDNSNANVTRWEATGVEECDEYTVTITWTSTNNASLITGEWTVKDGDGNTLAYICPLDCSGASAEVCE